MILLGARTESCGGGYYLVLVIIFWNNNLDVIFLCDIATVMKIVGVKAIVVQSGVRQGDGGVKMDESNKEVKTKGKRAMMEEDMEDVTTLR